MVGAHLGAKSFLDIDTSGLDAAAEIGRANATSKTKKCGQGGFWQAEAASRCRSIS